MTVAIAIGFQTLAQVVLAPRLDALSARVGSQPGEMHDMLEQISNENSQVRDPARRFQVDE